MSISCIAIHVGQPSRRRLQWTGRDKNGLLHVSHRARQSHFLMPMRWATTNLWVEACNTLCRDAPRWDSVTALITETLTKESRDNVDLSVNELVADGPRHSTAKQEKGSWATHDTPLQLLASCHANTKTPRQGR
jgi:hypothetical protein